MKITLVSQCKKNFNFRPLQGWPKHLPAYAWGTELLCGFDSTPEKAAIDLSGDLTGDLTGDLPETGSTLEKIFADIHPSLSLAELARLKSLEVFSKSELEYLIEINSLRPSQSLFELLAKLAETPIEFQNWTSERKFGAKELYALKAVPDLSELSPLLIKLVELKVSRQSGAQILENGIELFLMNPELPLQRLLAMPNESFETWGQRIFKLRHPMQSEKILSKEAQLASLAWPKFLKVRVIEHQASLVNEVKLQFRSSAELMRNIEALKKLQSEIEARA